MAIIGQSQVTIRDLNDPILLQSRLDSNHAKVQFLAGEGEYTPNYTSSPVVITPSLYIVQTNTDINVATSDKVKAIRWFYKLGATNTWTEIESTNSNFAFETVGSKNIKLKIIKNIMTYSNPQLAIKCELDFQESYMESPYTQKVEVDYSLSVQGNNGDDAYTVIMTNENHTIMCDSGGNPKVGEIGNEGRAKTEFMVLRGTSEMTATNSSTPSTNNFFVRAKTVPSGVTINKAPDSKTFYLDGSAIPESGKVVFEITVNGMSSKVEKEFNFNKTKDGESGGDAYIAVLSNDSHSVPTDPDGNNGNFTGCQTTINLYKGATLLTEGVIYSAVKSEGVTGSLSGNTYTVTNLTTDIGYVDLKVTYSGSEYGRRFTIVKQKSGSGENATAYWLVTSASAIARDKQGGYNPKDITLIAKSQTGNASPVDYLGRFKIEETLNNETWTQKYISSQNESSKTYIPSVGIKALRVTMYATGGTTNKLDEQVIPIVEDGTDGINAKSIEIVGQQVFKTDASGSTTPSQIVLNASLKNVTGTVQWQRKSGSSWINLATGVSTTITPSSTGWSDNQYPIRAYVVGQEDVYDEFTLYKVIDGKNSMVSYIYAPYGTIIKNHSRTSLDLQGNIFWGGVDKSTLSTAKYKWEKQEGNGSWTILRDFTSGNTGRNITIDADDIPNMLVVRCTFQFDGQTQTDTTVLTDQVDPYQITISSTAGYNFKNGEIDTHLVANVHRNGIQLDVVNLYNAIPPANNFQEGDTIYVTTDDKYRELVDGQWSILSEPPSIENSEFTYTWYKVDGMMQVRNSGEIRERQTYFNSGKIVRVGNRDVNQIANFRVVVEDQY